MSRRKTAFYTLLALQLAGSLVAVPKDLMAVFSNAFRVNELIDSVPPGETVVTDYFCLTSVAAYAAQPFYCIETNKTESFLKWNQEMARIDAKKNRYAHGANKLLDESGRSSFYLLSMNSPKMLPLTDTFLFKKFNVSLEEKREGAIEKYSNLYLYRISR